MLRDINLKAVYNSEEDNILEDFYIPAMSNSNRYDRAVGYFDAKMLNSAAAGLSEFIANNGRMRLICGSTLTEEEYIAISQGYEARDKLEKKIQSQLYELVEDASDPLSQHQLKALTWMVENDKLDIKIALRRRGIHHQKTGIFYDEDGDFIVFQGSANETNNALLPYNYEIINVFKSWVPGFSEHFEPHVKSFEKLWMDQARNTRVIDISQITFSVLTAKYPDVERPTIEHEIQLWQDVLDNEPRIEERQKIGDATPKIPPTINGREFKLHPHQHRALQKWQNNKYRGVLELATGAGKTITSIYGAIRLFETRKRLFLIVAVPYQNLADQWAENFSLFNIKPVVCYGGEGYWHDALTKATLNFKSGLVNFCAVIVVDATMTSKKQTFKNLISNIKGSLSNYFMFVGDECHHHGAYLTHQALPTEAFLRMGLSATPDRGVEDLGNQLIENYYGPVIDRYSLADALNDGVLTPYEYKVIPVPLTLDETEQYIELSKKIARLFAVIQNSTSKNLGDEDSLNALLLRRSRVINGSSNKPKALEKILANIDKPIGHSLFYCAEGLVEDDQAEEERLSLRQIEVISKVLNKYGWRSCQFTANESKSRRKIILDDFKNGQIDSLVAMKCLDEGVDIPLCSTAFILSSSRKERQFIQRRGRILRKSEGKTKAIIYDFVSILPLNKLSEPEIGRRLMIAELQRINEFAKLSLNRSDAYEAIYEYLKKYDLYHHIQ